MFAFFYFKVFYNTKYYTSAERTEINEKRERNGTIYVSYGIPGVTKNARYYDAIVFRFLIRARAWKFERNAVNDSRDDRTRRDVNRRITKTIKAFGYYGEQTDYFVIAYRRNEKFRKEIRARVFVFQLSSPSRTITVSAFSDRKTRSSVRYPFKEAN